MEFPRKMGGTPEKETGEPSTREGRPTHGSADAVPQGCVDVGSWLVSIATESNERLAGKRARRKPRIQKVPEIMREAGTNRRRCFEPEVVSLGPYHHGRPQLAAMEEHKRAAAARFTGGQLEPMRTFYERVMEVADEARGCYVDNFADLSDDEFAIMMFFDGCFILHFINCLEMGHLSTMTTPANLHGSIMRDILLLENQVPFTVLEALMSLRPVDCDGFIAKVAGYPTELRHVSGSGEQNPLHLLDLLRTRLLMVDTVRFACRLPGWRPQHTRADWQCVRSVVELKAAGIKCVKSPTRCLRDVRFHLGRLRGRLLLPQIVVDELTQSKFLNLIAFETCPDGGDDHGIASYICLLDFLINDGRDVKELRWKGILVNALGSDQQVADLVMDLAIGLSPNPNVYLHAVMGINRHYRSRTRVSLARTRFRRFRSPWATISFVAAVLLFVMTAVQTFFTVFSKFSVG